MVLAAVYGYCRQAEALYYGAVMADVPQSHHTAYYLGTEISLQHMLSS